MARWFVLLLPFAVGCVAFRPHLVPEPDDAVDHLALAAEALDRGDDRAASLQFSSHLGDHPDDAATRGQLAELLYRQGRFAEARQEYEAFVAFAQPMDGPVRELLPHAHTRLMLIAQDENDGAAEQLHRGIGLVALVESWGAADRDEALETRTLMKAVRALRAARAGHAARANLYLAHAYGRLGQPSAVRSARRAAEAAAPCALTPWERDRLAALAEQ